jgi:hypothetical protein
MSVLDAVIRLKELNQAKEQQAALMQQQVMQSGLESMMKVGQMAQENKQKSALLDIERQKAAAEINKNMKELELKGQQNDLINNLLNGQGVGGQSAGGQGVGSARVKGMTLDTGAGNVNVEFPQTDAEIQQGIDVKARTALAEKAAKGLEPAMAGKYANIDSAVQHKDELMSLLYPKNADGTYDTSKFNPDVKPNLGLAAVSPLLLAGRVGSQKYQRLHELLRDVNTAHKLTLTTRGVSGDVDSVKTRNAGELGYMSNPQAFAQQLENFFGTAEDTLKTMNPNYKGSTDEQLKTKSGVSFTYKKIGQ